MPTASRTTVSDTVRFRWDVLLFVVLVASSVPAVTQIGPHEWLGLVFVPLLLVHLVFNWRWITSITRRMFGSLPGEVRFNHIWDAILFVLFTLVILSGVLISERAFPMMGIHFSRQRSWRNIHDVTTTLFLIALGVHLAMHARWLVARVIAKNNVATALRILILLLIGVATPLLTIQLGKIPEPAIQQSQVGTGRPPRRPSGNYAHRFEKVAITMGIPGGLMLTVLAVIRLQRNPRFNRRSSEPL